MPRKSSPRKSPAQRKGIVMTDQSGLPPMSRNKLASQEAKHGPVQQLRQYDSGAVGAFFQDWSIQICKRS